ncbi:GNAT family N-acetyltransferase [Bacteroidota bacterium]
MIRIEKYTSEHKNLWNDFVKKSNNGTFLFDRNFMEYHKDRFVDFSLLCFKGTKLVAVLPANIVGNTLFSHQGLSYGGLLVLSSLKNTEYFNCYKSLLNYLEHQNIATIVLKTIPRIYDKSATEIATVFLQLIQANRTRVDSYFAIDMQNGYKPNRNRRRALKIGSQSEIEIKEEEGLAFFWKEILTKNLQSRFGANPTHTYDEIKLLKNTFQKEMLFYGAFQEGKMKAGVLMFVTDTVAHFQYSSGVDDRAENAALDVLFDAIIKKYKHKKFVSFGTCSECEGTKINEGLAYWKESFGANFYTQDFYAIDVSKQHLIADYFK